MGDGVRTHRLGFVPPCTPLWLGKDARWRTVEGLGFRGLGFRV